jgi:hypothetical protein
VPVCELHGAYNLNPTFFGEDRFDQAMTLRLQHGGGTQDYADNLVILVDDTCAVARLIAASPERDAQGQPVVTLPVGLVSTPGLLVHATMSFNQSCGRIKVTRLGQNVGLPAVSGTMTFRSIDVHDDENAVPGTDPDRTEVTAYHLVFRDDRELGPPPTTSPYPNNVGPHTPVGNAELSGAFTLERSRALPSVFFPPPP